MSRAARAFCLAVALCLALGASAVFAHTELLDSQPAAGATLAEPPAMVKLTFSQPLGEGSFIELYGEGFRAVQGVEPRPDPSAPEQMVVALPDLAPGTYTVQWSAASADGHEVGGSYSFTVEGPPAPSPSDRWWLLAAAAAGVALAALTFVVARRR